MLLIFTVRSLPGAGLLDWRVAQCADSGAERRPGRLVDPFAIDARRDPERRLAVIVHMIHRNRHGGVVRVDGHRLLDNGGPAASREGDVALRQERQGDFRPAPDADQRAAASVQREQDRPMTDPDWRRDRDRVHILVDRRQHGNRPRRPVRQAPSGAVTRA
jgi:hypothetical protein